MQSLIMEHRENLMVFEMIDERRSGRKRRKAQVIHVSRVLRACGDDWSAYSVFLRLRGQFSIVGIPNLHSIFLNRIELIQLCAQHCGKQIGHDPR